MGALIPAGALRTLRATSEATMRDRCTITRPSATPGVLDEDTLDVSDPAPVLIFEGMCRVRHLGAGGSDVIAAEGYVALAQYEATVPRTVVDVAEGDVLTVTASDDGQLMGRPLYVLKVKFAAENVHRRIVLEDRQ